MRKKIVFVYLFLFFFSNIFSQVGINIDLLTATLSVKSSSEYLPVILSRNSDNKEISKLLDSGYLGILATSPIAKLELRGSSSGGELGLGTTRISAIDAGAGAIRYNNGIEFSDGSTWIKLSTVPVKAYVIAKNDVEASIAKESNYTWNNWTSVTDVTNSFNAATGIFTAPSTGVYSISCTGMGKVTTSSSNLIHVELNIVTSSQIIKSAIATPVTARNKGKTTNITFVNKAFVYLDAGNTLFLRIYNGSNDPLKTSTDGSYNTLMISGM